MGLTVTAYTTAAPSAVSRGGMMQRRLASLVGHVAAPGALSATDNYANLWTVSGNTLVVVPPGRAAEAVQTPLAETDRIAGLAADDRGYVWITDGARRLFRLNPRGPHYGPPGPGGGVQYSAADGSHTVWHTFDSASALPAGTIVALKSSGTRDFAAVTMSTGALLEVSMNAAGSESSATAVPAEPTAATTLRWEVAGGRLPCGNHDIYAAQGDDGRVYVSGGALWYRGYPARMCEFDELWCCTPENFDDPDAWSVVDEKMPPIAFDRGDRGRSMATGPGSRCYNGLAALGQELWVVGGCCSADGIPNNRTAQDSCVVYNTHTKAWRSAPSLKHARSACIAAAVGGRIYCMGSRCDVVESIAPGESEWREEGTLPEGAGAGASCVLEGKIYIVDRGGVFAFDPAAKDGEKWDTTIPALPHGGGVGSAQVAAHNGCVWVIAGVGERATFHFDPTSRSWTRGPDLPTSQSWGAAWSAGGVLLCIGGAHWLEEEQTYHFDNRVFKLVEP